MSSSKNHGGARKRSSKKKKGSYPCTNDSKGLFGIARHPCHSTQREQVTLLLRVKSRSVLLPKRCRPSLQYTFAGVEPAPSSWIYWAREAFCNRSKGLFSLVSRAQHQVHGVVTRTTSKELSSRNFSAQSRQKVSGAVVKSPLQEMETGGCKRENLLVAAVKDASRQVSV